MQKVAYLGPIDSYSYLAAKAFLPQAEYLPYDSFFLAVKALERGESDFAVLPVENSLNGSVRQVLDLLQAEDGIVGKAELSLPLDHRLATLKDAEISGISRIYSHEQPLAQCQNYIFTHFPKAKLFATASTAASLERVLSVNDAAIVGAHVKREGLKLSDENISDVKNNFTQFFLVGRGVADQSAHCKKIYFSVTCRHCSGALLDVLSPIRAGGLNMTKIESRPIKERSGEYRFFIEVEADLADGHTKSVLDEVRAATNSFKILATY